ncbi:hypothetical protein AAC387_Pa03g1108 [Persea americana]
MEKKKKKKKKKKRRRDHGSSNFPSVFLKTISEKTRKGTSSSQVLPLPSSSFLSVLFQDSIHNLIHTPAISTPISPAHTLLSYCDDEAAASLVV